MPDKAEKKPDAAATDKKDAKASTAQGAVHGHAGGKRGIMGMVSKTPVMLGGVMILEAVVLFGGFKFLGGGAPQTAGGAEISAEESHGDVAASEDDHGGGHGGGEKKIGAKKKTLELKVLDFRAPNKQSGRTFLYDVSIYVVTKSEFETQVTSTITDRTALITDRVRTIIAQSDPEKLGGGSEPGLETLRRQVKYQLDEIVGEGMISEVLIPRCIPFRTDY